MPPPCFANSLISGAIEVAAHSDKKAKLIKHLAAEDSDDEPGTAAAAFEAVQRQTRVTASTNDDGTEISLKVPKATQEDEELNAMLWGPCNDEHSSAPASSSNGDSSSGLWSLSLEAPVSKKMHQEAKELDKIEAVILQANQLKRQLEDSRSVGQVSIVKAARAMLSKIDAKKDDPGVSKMVLELCKKDGNQCRASQVWEGLRGARSVVEAGLQFVEALHDQEAGADTLRTAAAQIKDCGVQLPRSVNMILCRRGVEKLVHQNELDKIFTFLDPKCTDEVPSGIASVLPKDEEQKQIDAVITDVQSGCVIHCINQILLREFCEAARSPGSATEDAWLVRYAVSFCWVGVWLNLFDAGLPNILGFRLILSLKDDYKCFHLNLRSSIQNYPITCYLITTYYSNYKLLLII